MTQERNDKLSARNVDMHQLTPSEIELMLERTDRGYQIMTILHFQEKTSDGKPRMISQLWDIGNCWHEDALAQYDNYKTRLFSGQYKLHYFDDGTLEVELKQ